MVRMWRIVFREIFVLLGGLSLFVVLLVVAIAQNDSLSGALKLISRAASSRALLRLATIDPVLWLKVLAPYLIIQVIRAYRWSQRSIRGRRWANIYFFALLTGLACWTIWRTWDMFFFMYSLGGIPAELGQFLSLEGFNILLFVASSLLAIHCLRIAIRRQR